MYTQALEVGLLPAEFWELSLQEIRDTVNSRIRQKDKEIYALSSMIRVAVLSAFSADVKFPAPPHTEDKAENWKNSYNYLKALQAKQKEVRK